MGSILIHTQDESVTLTAQAVRRLLEKGDGDAALLYLALLRRHGTVQPRSLAGELRWDRLRIEAAEGTLRELELVAPQEAPPAPADARPAYQRAAVAERLGIPFETADIRAELEREVCAPFAADYRAGRTPLPCARCNPAVKFPALFALAGRIGARYVSTGHYARVENGVLKKGMPANDQSYMLARLTREQLQKVIFPLGDYEKNQVRALARGFGIPVADKPDSMEICFIPDGDYAAWLERRGFSTPEGNFVDKEGKVLGRHRGIHCYTLGQGRGLGVSGPHRYYVTALRPDSNEVVLSDGSDLGRDEVRGTEPNWLAVDSLTGPMEVTVRLRHSKTQLAATLEPEGDGVLLRMHTPARAPTPGQLAVFYDGDAVVGSAWIV